MPVTSDDFLNFARDCVIRDDEIGFRNAVARSYYSAYHLVNPLMRNGPKDNHQGLIDYLKGDASRGHESYSKRNLIAVAYILQSLKDQRIICDYELNDLIGELQAKTAIITTEKLMTKCTEMMDEVAVS
ncbi:hypothetical protein [Yersinia proxima]|uniref:hypothetical protein n=1 Tax=Yersinia proxima TaxID=2890316 RepID=UPI001D0FC420|nr:hypothetical protein [Yersinia proxima]